METSKITNRLATGASRLTMAAIFAALLNTAVSAAQVQSIQIGAYDSQAEAAAAKTALPTDISPAFIYIIGEGEKPYKLCVGHFTVYAEAHAYRAKLKSDAFPGNWIRTVDISASEIRAANLPVELPFKLESSTVPSTMDDEVLELGGFTAEPEPEPELLQKAPSQMTTQEQERVGMAIARHPFQAVPALEAFLESNKNHPSANKSRLRLARVLGRGQNIARAETLLSEVIRKGKPAERVTARFLLAHAKYNKNANEEAYEAFRALASDRQVPGKIRRQSMRLAAGTAHRNGSLPTAWLCFSQIAESSPDAKEVAEARLQLAGLAMELAGREKGTYEEARALCTALAQDPNTPEPIKVTARLMSLESYFHEKRYTESLAAADEFLLLHGDVPREGAVARGFRGMALLYLQRIPEAKAALTQVADLQLDATEKFARLDPRPRAAIWLAYIAGSEGDTDARDRWIDFIRSEYPDGEEARTIASLFPNL